MLYVDHQGHPAPLSMCYHATASRRLASAIDRQPPSTVTEIDSAFCPQCLAFHDATSAAITVDSDGVVDKGDLEKASEELEAQWTERRTQRDQSADDHYKTMLQTLEEMAKEQVKGQRSTFSWLPTANVRRKDGPEGWSIESLEDSLQDRKKLVSASLAETVGGQELQAASLFVEQLLDESLKGKSIESVLLQGGATPIVSLDSLLPLPVPLRPRKSRRCRGELAEGRPGILVKPKLNPLEGDSSLRTGHAQWWKKDSSAVQVLPRVRVTKHASDDTKHAFLLKVSNPTLGKIRMRLASSKYSGEPVWDEPSKTTSLLQNILLDIFTDKHVDAELTTDVVQGLTPTDVCELEPAEDSFLELGQSANDVPELVSMWDATDVLSNSQVSSEGLKASLKLLATKNSSAWFEIVVLESSKAKGVDTSSAVPLEMQIEVGNGSWESSLVQPELKDGSGDAKDMVSFSLVIIWDT